MILTKKDIIQKLYDIETKEGLKLGKEVQQVIRNETIPIKVITLINQYDKEFLQIYDTYNTIYLSRKRNPLYKNLKSSTIEISELAIALSSLITKVLISCSKIENLEERCIFAKAMNVDRLSRALSDYSIYNNSEELLQCGKEIRELLTILYKG